MANEQIVKKLAYYEDDYVRHGVILETDVTPEIRFMYKPLNMIQAANLTDAVIDGKNILSTAKAIIKLLTKHIVEWNLEKQDGVKVDWTIDSELEKIDAKVLQKIAAIIRRDSSTFEEDVAIVRDEVKNL